ncbi:MAG: hypothetical protein M1830_006446 [Pleopsidium flavum]|nr:MAG: hypothetical protein M1830_006446 [Pleopsidium flavum]
MAKRGGKKFGGGRGGRGGRGGQRSQQRADYQEVQKHNDLFERFYNELDIVEDSERTEFWTALRRDLPNSFRFTGSKGHALSVQQRLKDYYIPQITSIEHNGEPVNPPTSIPWYPDQLAWQMTTPKSVIRRFPPFASFQKYLVSETSVGNISRQEVVSMIPPLLMDVKPGMTVLDLCAAPGSKAAQLIEMVHGGEEERVREVTHKMAEQAVKQAGRNMSPDGAEIQVDIEEKASVGDWSDDGRTTGLLIANDADYKRAHMLVHQMKRLNSPNLIVTNHDATLFPSIKVPSTPAVDGRSSQAKYLKFDRILADVPCSGDGTCRKNPNIWKDWNPGNALGLFTTQVRILVRALQMLKVGGRVVYSTCSMNPVENEAVIATAVARCGGLGKVGLVDCSVSLPDLKRKSGLQNWKVMDKQGKIWQSWQEVEDYRAKEGSDGLGRLAEGMFPPASTSDQSVNFPFKRCMRVYGHLQDTGGFFITVLEKQSEIKAKPESEGKKPDVRVEPKTSIIAAVEEIEAQPINRANPVEKIDALDAIAPPQESGEEENPSAAARQNMENAPTEKLTSLKHELADEADAEMSTKRIKFREETDEAAPRGEEDRQVHWPPPPGAQLDVSRPETVSLKEPASSPQQRKKNNQPFEEPFKYLEPDHGELQTIYEFYDLSSRFPRDRFMVRNAMGNPVKTIYYTSSLARSILTENEGKGMKFVHCGVKMFVKQDVQKVGVCKWRIQHDGLPLLEAFVGDERVVKLWSRNTLRKLLVEMFPKVDGDGWRDLGEIGERVRDLEMGCCVLRVEQSEGDDGFRGSMVLPLWRSLHSLNLMLPKEDRKALLLRLYNDDSPLLDNSKDRFLNKQNGAASDVAAIDAGQVADEGVVDDVAAAEVSQSEGDGVQWEDDSYVAVGDE